METKQVGMESTLKKPMIVGLGATIILGTLAISQCGNPVAVKETVSAKVNNTLSN